MGQNWENNPTGSRLFAIVCLCLSAMSLSVFVFHRSGLWQVKFILLLFFMAVKDVTSRNEKPCWDRASDSL